MWYTSNVLSASHTKKFYIKQHLRVSLKCSQSLIRNLIQIIHNESLTTGVNCIKFGLINCLIFSRKICTMCDQLNGNNETCFSSFFVNIYELCWNAHTPACCNSSGNYYYILCYVAWGLFKFSGLFSISVKCNNFFYALFCKKKSGNISIGCIFFCFSTDYT